jgi:hypothetical protein
MRYAWHSVPSTNSCNFQPISAVTYRSNTNVRVRFYPCLIKHHSTETCDRMEIAPRILDIGQPYLWPSHIPQKVTLRWTLIVGRVSHRVGVGAVEVRSVGAHGICALLGYYAACSGNTFPRFRDKLSVPSWPFEMGLLGCPETSVTYHHYKLCNIEEERRSRRLCDGSLKWGKLLPHSDITIRCANNASLFKATAPSDAAWMWRGLLG